MNCVANWRFQRSLSRVFLMAEMSQLLTSGARTELNADDRAITLDASCWLETRLNAAVLNHCATVRCPAGKVTSAMVMPGSSKALPKPRAWPLWKVKIPCTCQPLTAVEITRFEETGTRRLRPN